MTTFLGVVSVVLLAASLTLVVFMVVRRVVLERREEQLAAAEMRLRPLAIGLVENAAPELPTLSKPDQEVFAGLLGRYSRKLSGEASARIGAYFRVHGGWEDTLARLRSRRAHRRASAAYTLGDMQCAEAVPALLEALEDDSAEVRGAAARSLGRLGDRSVALPLVEGLVARRLPRGVAGESLLRLGASVTPELHRIARHPEPEIRAAAVSLIGLVGDPRDSGEAVRALRDPSAAVRAAAAEALGRIGSAAGEEELRTTLDDRVHYVRAAAARTLGTVGTRSALPRLLEIARTDRFRPARAAAQAVARIDPATLATAAAAQDAGPHLHEAADLQAL